MTLLYVGRNSTAFLESEHTPDENNVFFTTDGCRSSPRGPPRGRRERHAVGSQSSRGALSPTRLLNTTSPGSFSNRPKRTFSFQLISVTFEVRILTFHRKGQKLGRVIVILNRGCTFITDHAWLIGNLFGVFFPFLQRVLSCKKYGALESLLLRREPFKMRPVLFGKCSKRFRIVVWENKKHSGESMIGENFKFMCHRTRRGAFFSDHGENLSGANVYSLELLNRSRGMQATVYCEI